MPERPYIYYDFTISICSTCLKRVDAKIIFEDEKVFMLKNCLQHGHDKPEHRSTASARAN